MGCSIKGYGKEGPLVIDGHPNGLILNHAYGIRDVLPFKDYEGKIQKLMFLRNPWGKGESNGAWSKDSEEFRKNKKLFLEYNDNLDKSE
jgi:Calpain family cysteine protease